MVDPRQLGSDYVDQNSRGSPRWVCGSALKGMLVVKPSGVPRRGIEYGAAVFVSAAVASFYVFIARCHGAIGVSRNDDWTYYRSAFQVQRDGHFNPDAYTITMLVGQTYLVQPLLRVFGAQIAPLQIFTCVLSAIGLLTTYFLLRGFLSPWWSGFAAGCMALGPIYGTLSTSFMTDVPSFAFQTLCLATGVRALRKKAVSTPWLTLSALIGLAAFSIREYSIAAPLTILLISTIRAAMGGRKLSLLRVTGLWALWLAATIGLYLWRSVLNQDNGPSLGVDLAPRFSDFRTLARLVFTTSLFITPGIVLIGPRRIALAARRQPRASMIATALVVGIWVMLAYYPPILLGNYLQPAGSYPETLTGRGPFVISPGIWAALMLVSLVSALSIVILVLEGLAKRKGGIAFQGMHRTKHGSVNLAVASLFGMLTLAVLGGAYVVAGGIPLFDRYLFPAVPFLTGVLVYVAHRQRITRTRTIAATISLVLVAILGFAVVDAAATFDGAKWRLARSVQKEGYPAASIDAGLEWFGFHQQSPIVPYKFQGNKANFWLGLFRNTQVCVVVSSRGWDENLLGNGGPTRIDRLEARSLLGAKFILEARIAKPQCSE